MRIYYHLSSYISHKLSGLEFANCLKLLGHSVSFNPNDDADFAVLHDDPVVVRDAAAALPKGLPFAAYCVWETDGLPPSYTEILRAVPELWTCSEFCRRSFASVVPRTFTLPHVVRRRPPAFGALAEARKRLGGKEGFVFFTVTDSINPRKNLTGLLTAFSVLRERTKVPVRLAVKQYRLALNLQDIPGVISICGDLSPEEMAALYAASDAYVSAHHAEGWGLGISEAMAYGKPAAATGWSGNMEYMTPENSLPVPYTLVPVSEEMHYRLPVFTRDMLWADPDPAALVRIMKNMAEGRIPPDIGRNAAGIVDRFSEKQTAETLRRLLAPYQ